MHSLFVLLLLCIFSLTLFYFIPFSIFYQHFNQRLVFFYTFRPFSIVTLYTYFKRLGKTPNLSYIISTINRIILHIFSFFLLDFFFLYSYALAAAPTAAPPTTVTSSAFTPFFSLAFWSSRYKGSAVIADCRLGLNA